MLPQLTASSFGRSSQVQGVRWGRESSQCGALHSNSRLLTQAKGMSWGSAAAMAAGLDAELLSKVSTVFVPSDDAIKAYVTSSGATSADLATGSGKSAVTAHVIPNKTLTSADFPEGSSSYNTVAGAPLTVSKAGGQLTVSAGSVTANVIQSDISTGNATIFLIDNVLSPVV